MWNLLKWVPLVAALALFCVVVDCLSLSERHEMVFGENMVGEISNEFLENYDPFRYAVERHNAAAQNPSDPQDVSLLQVSAQVGKFQHFCEICILIMHMKQKGVPQICGNMNQDNYLTCVMNLESLLRADKALTYWIKNGCMHYSPTGPEIVPGCSALAICSWVPNLFAPPPYLQQDSVEALCPADPKFAPTIPDQYKHLLTQANQPR